MKHRASPVRSVFLCFVTIFLLLAGCKTQMQDKIELRGTNAPQKEPVKMKMTFWGTPNEKNAIEKACSEFSAKHPWIAVEPIQIANDDYNRSLVRMHASGSAPDIGYMTADLGEIWANEGIFVNLFELLEIDKDIKKEDFLDYLWYKTAPDRAWGVGTAGECFGLFYNKSILKNAGMEFLPTTAEDAMNWDEFVALTMKLTLDIHGKNAADPEFDPENIKQYGVMFETWSESLNNFIYSNGGEWVSEDGKAFTLNSQETVDAIQKIADLINVYHVAPSPLQSKSLPPLNISLQTGLTAMVVGGQWLNLDLGKAHVEYDVGVLPKMKKSITINVSGATVLFNSSQYVEESWELFKWLSNPDKCIHLYSDGLWMPTLKKWYTDPILIQKWVDVNPLSHPPGFKNAIMNQFMNNGIPQPRFYLKNQAVIEPIVISGLDKVWLGEKTAGEALKEIEAKVKPEYRGRYEP